MILLAEGHDDVVAYQAVEFGKQLFHGGNEVAQKAVLANFEEVDGGFFGKVVEKMHKCIKVCGPCPAPPPPRPPGPLTPVLCRARAECRPALQ